ncbi:MAG TPA: hypothetical protein VNV25_25165 [Gemmatimonadaceae bacterium]|jgi:hypothetical protein|nr:hypothetical protein [Gemmatimonadaceae bacterium]
MTPAQLERLRTRLRAAIERDGIGAVSRRVEVQPVTILRFLSGSGTSHRGTIKQIAAGLK